MLFTDKKQDEEFWRLADECLDEVKALAGQKSGDYNRMCDAPDYLPRGWPDGALHVWKCALRLLNLAMVPGRVHSKNEALEDTLLDIVNWARYSYALMKMEEAGQEAAPASKLVVSEEALDECSVEHEHRWVDCGPIAGTKARLEMCRDCMARRRTDVDFDCAHRWFVSSVSGGVALLRCEVCGERSSEQRGADR